MQYNITYLTPTAQRGVRTVEASSDKEALALLRLPASRVIAVRPAATGWWAKLLTYKPSTFDQISTLAALGSVVSSGNSAESAFKQEIKSRPKYAKALADTPAGASTSDKLRRLNFDPTVVMLVRAGESAGDLASAITTAAENLSDRLRINQQLNKGIKPAMLMLTLMSSALFGMPRLFVPIIKTIQSSKGLVVNTNLATDIMFVLKWSGDNLWFLGLVLPVLAFVFRRRIWEFLRFRPFFRQLDSLDRCRRAVQFLSAYIPLDGAGIGSIEILRSFRENAPNALERQLFASQIEQTLAGKPLSETFDSTRFPDVFINAVRGIEKAPDATVRKNVLGLIRRNILTLTDITAERLMVMFKVIQWAMVIFVIGLMVVGVYLPLMTIHQGVS